MGFDIPDGPQPVITIQVVATEPVAETPATEYAIDSYGVVSTSSSSYQTLKSWTVTANRVGVLRSVEMACDNYAVAQFKLVVGAITVFEDKKLPESFTKEFPDIRLAAAAAVTLSVKSDGSTTITAYADFSAKEVG